jgi:nucleotide-binding universal stress UspA family protein
MSAHPNTAGKERIVCGMSASSGSARILEAAVAYCRESDAELVVVWVVSRVELLSAAGTAMPGTWGLVGAHGLLLERLRDAHVVVGTSFRVGDPRVVLEEEQRAFGADRVFTAADVPVRRCPACGGRDDLRGIHFCPVLHRAEALPGVQVDPTMRVAVVGGDARAPFDPACRA